MLAGKTGSRGGSYRSDNIDLNESERKKIILDVIHGLGLLYADQDKLKEAEKMYERALREREEALSLNHTSTLQTINNLGLLYTDQGKLAEAEKMYKRALRGYEDTLGLENIGIY